MLLGLVCSGGGGAGHWESIDIERARELLEKQEYAGLCVRRAREKWAVAEDKTGATAWAGETPVSDYGVNS